jgi:hypothetical protein
MAAQSITSAVQAAVAAGLTPEQLAAATGCQVLADGERWETLGRQSQTKIFAYVETLTRVSFTKVDGEWGVKGRGLVSGAEVTVTKRDGSTKSVHVGRIVSDVDGVQVATIGSAPTVREAAPEAAGPARPTTPHRGWSNAGVRRAGYASRSEQRFWERDPDNDPTGGVWSSHDD